jgi:hypothetical protein
VSSAKKKWDLDMKFREKSVQNIPVPGGRLWNFGIFLLIRGNFLLEISKVIWLFGFA